MCRGSIWYTDQNNFLILRNILLDRHEIRLLCLRTITSSWSEQVTVKQIHNVCSACLVVYLKVGYIFLGSKIIICLIRVSVTKNFPDGVNSFVL